MKPDKWTVTRTDTLANGNVRVIGVHRDRGPFQVVIPLEEYVTHGVHAAVRAYYHHHPTVSGPAR